MSGGGKGGSSTTQVQIPAWLESAAQSNLARADRLAQLGYTPYYGPDVAAMTPMQIAAMQGTNQAAAAFGMPSVDAMAGMPAPQTFAGGVQGYSSGGLYDQSLAELQARAPGQYAALRAPFIDPVTGAQPSAPFGAGGGGPAAMAAPALSPAEAVIANYQNNIRNGNDSRSMPNPTGTLGGGGSGTGSFGLPDPMTGKFAGTNFPGPVGNVVNAVTRSASGGGGSGGMGGGK